MMNIHIRNATALLTLLSISLLSLAQKAMTPSSASVVHTSDSSGKGTPCLFSAERGLVPDCIRKDAAGKLHITPRYAKELDFDEGGLAPVKSESQSYGWMYVNRSGIVVITGVPTFDNWADEFHEGLVRTVKVGKVGFANRKGNIVIPRIYDWASPFEKGVAEACIGCRVEDCSAAAECEHRRMVGGKWLRIDRSGKSLTPLSSIAKPRPSL